MIKGAIFDLDGTLLDSMFIWDSLPNDYLESLGIHEETPLSPLFKTFTTVQAAEYFIEHYALSLSVDEIIAGINDTVRDFYENRAQLKAGVPEFLEALNCRGVGICLATVNNEDLIKHTLRRCGVLDLFSEIFTSSALGCDKRSPLIYETALKHLGTAKAETWVFEDALHAAETAYKAGFPLVGVYDPSESQPQELKKISRIYLEDMRDFKEFWKKASV